MLFDIIETGQVFPQKLTWNRASSKQIQLADLLQGLKERNKHNYDIIKRFYKSHKKRQDKSKMHTESIEIRHQEDNSARQALNFENMKPSLLKNKLNNFQRIQETSRKNQVKNAININFQSIFQPNMPFLSIPKFNDNCSIMSQKTMESSDRTLNYQLKEENIELIQYQKNMKQLHSKKLINTKTDQDKPRLNFRLIKKDQQIKTPKTPFFKNASQCNRSREKQVRYESFEMQKFVINYLLPDCFLKLQQEEGSKQFRIRKKTFPCSNINKSHIQRTKKCINMYVEGSRSIVLQQNQLINVGPKIADSVFIAKRLNTGKKQKFARGNSFSVKKRQVLVGKE